MVNGLNIQTLYLVGAVVTIASAGATLLTWYHHRSAPGLKAWMAALALTSLGALVLRFRTSPSDLALTYAADAVIVLGFAGLWASLALFNRRQADPVRIAIRMALVVMGFVAMCVALHAAGFGPRATAVPFSFFLGMLALGAGHEVWAGRHVDDLRSRLPTALAFAGLGLARLVRAGSLALEVWQVSPPRSAAMIHPYTLYAAVVFTVVITYGLVMMANERAVRRDEALFAGR